ncbi:MAG TPA: DUF429 domain-containing protein [Myxococcota bacterium]|nr:DUF429 domain-containing protein [Myxococcota bacterium]
MAVLGSAPPFVRCEWVRGLSVELGRVPEAERLADWLAALSDSCGARFVVIDGPQAWKDEANGLVHQRRCERELATQAKTGPPGRVLPGTQRRFTLLSIALFDSLARRGLPRFDPARPCARAALEVFPTASWRALGRRPLPGKRRSSPAQLAGAAEFLRRQCGLRFRGAPTHDELQAAVAGLAGLALCGHPGLTWTAHGTPPAQVGGTWREGVIGLASLSNSSR